MLRRVKNQRSEITRSDPAAKCSQAVYHMLENGEMYNCTLCARIEFDKGAGIDYHRHDGELEIYIVTKGLLEVNDNGVVSMAEPGDVLLTLDGESHAIFNHQDELGEILAIIIKKQSSET